MFVADIETKILNFYSPAGALYRVNVAESGAPFAETILESSPLNRPIKQGSPGTPWQPGTNIPDPYNSTDRTVKFAYETNVDGEVLLWAYTNPTLSFPLGLVNAGTATVPVYYTANQLYKNKTRDEEYNEVIEYKDKEGKTVLKKVQAPGGLWAQTYYIYDDFQNLVCVIPPEAVAKLATEYYHTAATDATKDSFLKRWAFRYTYDSRKRMTQKQVPGADPVYMVYDNRDRLVLTQDGNQRAGATNAIKYWTFTKYDELNRPIATGIKDTTTTTQLTQAQMQSVVDTYYSLMATTKPWRKYGEKYVGPAVANNVHGYTNVSYPVMTNAATLNANSYLTVTYYDNYDFRSSWVGTYIYVNDALSQTVNSVLYTQPATENLRVAGQVTGQKMKVLDGGITGGSTWLRTVSYYDDKYRVIQTISDNYKAGTDRNTTLYDFTGKVLKTKTVHNESDVTWKDRVGVAVIGNKLIKNISGSGWNTAGAVSQQQLTAGQNGWMEVLASETNFYRMVGFSDQNTDANYATIDYAIYQAINGALYIYESGTNRGSISGGYKSGDVLKIDRSGTTIRYYRNNTIIYTSTVPSSTLLFLL